mgnify:CR=1 FL=1
MKKLVLMLLMFAPLATFAQQKFGHINAQEVMSQMPEFIKARGEMEAKAKQMENDLKAMQDELQRKSQEYDKNKSTMNATKQQETETELHLLPSQEINLNLECQVQARRLQLLRQL